MLGTQGPSSPPSNRLTVLFAPPPITDRDPPLPIIQHLLSPLGINLLTANTGREALSILESQPIHIAILDQRLPQLSGLQVIKLVREHQVKRQVPVQACTATILLTDQPSNALLHDALAYSVFTVLAKPIHHDQLLDALARAMRKFHNSQWPTSNE